MKKLTMMALFAGFLTVSLSSCRDQKTEQEKVIEKMEDKGADVDVSQDGDKIKMETDDEKVKIKTDDDGNVKIKDKDKN